jgi:uncharacterized membrane protein YeaQ/YmgE (transglycosylase-associated protein family)
MPQTVDLIGWIVIGFLAGVVAGWFVPDRGRMGCLGTTVLGVIGALVGGWLWTEVLNQSRASGFLGALLIAILGSAFVLVLIRGMSRR